MPTAAISARPSSLSEFAATIPGRIVLSLAATVIVAVSAHIAIPLPFTPVPLSMAPLAVLGVGLALGPVVGFFTLLAYLAEGAMGLPVFSPTGPGGIAQILGPTGGFLMSYPLVAAIVGLARYLHRSAATRAKRFGAATVTGFASGVVLFAMGAGWFMHFTHHTLYATWIGSIAPFLPGEVIKVLAAAAIYSAVTYSTRPKSA